MQLPHKVYTENIHKLKGKVTGIFTKTIPIPIRATSAHNLGKEPYLMTGSLHYYPGVWMAAIVVLH